MTSSVCTREMEIRGDSSRDCWPGAVGGVVVLMVTYIATTLVQGLLNAVPINRFIGFVLVALLAYEWVSTRKSHASYVVALVFVLLSLRSVVVMTDASWELSDWTYLASTLLIFALVFSDSSRSLVYQALVRHRSYVLLVVVGSALLLLWLLLTRTGYVSAWGEEPYFRGLCNSEHTLASICILLLVSIVFLVRTAAPRFLCVVASLVVLYALLETGARTYLVPALVCALLLIDGLVARRWAKVFLIACAVGLGIVAFMGSGMASKFDFVQGNIWADSIFSAFTNGRDEIWATDLSAWAHSGPVGMLAGSSFSSIYDLNEAALTLSIWAHNDFIMILYGAGLVGLFLYVGSLCLLFRSMRSVLSRGYFLLLLIFVLFPLFLNGFFPYQHLVYAFALLYVICSCSEICGKGADG